MKRTIIITILGAVIVTLIACLSACSFSGHVEDADKEVELEQEIIARACEEMETSSDGATLQYIFSEPIPWAEGDAYCYALTAAGKCYLVGVRRDKTTIYYVDVESELTVPEDCC